MNSCPFLASGTTPQAVRTQMPSATGDRGEFLPYYSARLHAELEHRRRHEPVFWCEEIGYWVLTRHADVYRVLHDGVRFSSQNTTRPLNPMHPDAQAIVRDGGYAPTGNHSSLDGDAHRRIRSTTSQVLNLREFVGMHAQVRELVEQAIDRIAHRDTIDLLADFCYELPAQVVFKVLGIPDSDIADVKKWAGARSVIDFSPASYEQQMTGARNMVAFWQYCVEMVNDRLKHPRADFTSRILAIRNGDDAVMTLPEAVNHTFGVAFAGHETTTNQLTNTFRELMSHPDQWRALCNEPSLAANAVEEGMRYAGAVIGWRRIALEEVELSGVKIPKGAPILLSLASANRDEAVFENAQRFDIRRKNARKQLTFGNGVHFCLGAPLARMEMKIVLERFAIRFPRMRLIEPDAASYMHTFIFRAPSALHVALR